MLTRHIFIHKNKVSKPQLMAKADFPSEVVFLCSTLASCASMRPIQRQCEQVLGREFDPHRPYQPNRLKTHVLAQVHFPVYLWCTLAFSRNTMQSPQGASAKLDISGSMPPRSGLPDNYE